MFSVIIALEGAESASLCVEERAALRSALFRETSRALSIGARPSTSAGSCLPKRPDFVKTHQAINRTIAIAIKRPRLMQGILRLFEQEKMRRPKAAPQKPQSRETCLALRSMCPMDF